MWQEHRGAFILSVSLHLAALILLAIAALATPNKEPEAFIFELYGEPGEVIEAPALAPIQYASEQVEMPDPEQFEPEIAPPPEPITGEEPEPVVEEAPEMSLEEFKRQFGDIKPTNIRNTPPKKPDLSQEVDRLTRDLSSLMTSSDAAQTIQSLSSGQKKSLQAYFNSLKIAIRDSVERHSLGMQPLEARIRFNLAANGSLSNAQLLSGSGDPIYDRKVLEAFKRLRIFQPTPFGKSHSLTMTVEQAQR